MPPLARLLPALAALTLTTPALAAPAMWEVRDGDSAIKLFGSFHVLPEGQNWRTPLFDAALAAADKVVFETDVGPMAIAEAGAVGFARGIYVDGTLLTDVIDDNLEDQLRGAAASSGLPVGSLLAMRPWFAANTIAVSAMQAAGFTELGVEFVLQPELPVERLSFLESGDEQIEVLAGAPESEQISLLESTLDQLGTLSKTADKMMLNWMNGTPENLAELFVMDMGGAEGPFLERLLYARNRNWIAPIEAMLAENQQNLVIVGAAHLIGEDSVLDLLEQAGYEVERIQ